MAIFSADQPPVRLLRYFEPSRLFSTCIFSVALGDIWDRPVHTRRFGLILAFDFFDGPHAARLFVLYV